MPKMIRVDAGAGVVKAVDLPRKYARLGGRGLTSRIILDEVDPAGDPLGPGAKVVLAAGLLTGTPAPCSAKLSVGGRSPLTGGIKESNVGGRVSLAMANSQIRCIVFEGQPAKKKTTKILVNGKKGLRLENAPSLRGLGTFETASRLGKKFGKDAGMLIVGPAGEMGLPSSTIASVDLEGYPSRHAARGGLGSVLASKGIKAIVFPRLPGIGSTVSLAEEKAFRAVSNPFSKSLVELKHGLTVEGTAVMVATANEMGGIATKNYTRGSFSKIRSLTGRALYETIVERGGKPSVPCLPGCVIRCSNLLPDKNGKYLTSSLEYETIILAGPNLTISDLDAVARIDRTCDDIGVDAIETCVSLGIMMEAGVIPWGDADAVLGMLEKIRQGDPLGRLLASGARTVGRVLGVKRVAQVKGQSCVAYDPRIFQGMGASFATSPMGADHTSGPATPGRKGIDQEKDYGEFSEGKGKMDLSADLQVMIAVCDSMGFCFFVGPELDVMEKTAAMLRAAFRWRVTTEDVLEMGRSVLRDELEFNRRAGFTKEDDRLPDFFYNEPLPPTGKVFEVPREQTRGALAKRLGKVKRR